jgi:hypothetical protein
MVEPHVAIRIKRVFSKIDTWQYGTLSISATPENCLDLQWFVTRYPLIISPEAEDRINGQAVKYKEKVALVDQLLSGGGSNPSIYPLKLPARVYQNLAAQLWLANYGLLLADDVGLGKTLEAIIGLNDPRTLPALVVTLSHLPQQWEKEIHKFTDLTTHILKKGTPYDILKYTDGKLPDVFICNYHKLSGWVETLTPVVHSFVADECVTGDTKITYWPITKQKKSISSVLVGDTIASFDEKGEVAPDTVVSVTSKGKRETWRVTLQNGLYLDCTINEKILTEKGWVYLKDILDAASIKNSTKQTYSPKGDSTATSFGLSIGGYEHGSLLNLSSIENEPRKETGSVCSLQSEHIIKLHSHSSKNCPEWRVRGLLVPVYYSDQPCLRVLTEPLSRKSKRKMEESGYSRVAKPTNVGRSGVLDDGRWQPYYTSDQSDHNYEHSILPKRTSGDAFNLVSFKGDFPSGGQHQDQKREGRNVLCTEISDKRNSQASEQDKPLYTGLYEVQGTTSPDRYRICDMHSLRHSIIEEKSQDKRFSHMPENRMHSICYKDLACKTCGALPSMCDLLCPLTPLLSKVLPELYSSQKNCKRRNKNERVESQKREISSCSSPDPSNLFLVRGYDNPPKRGSRTQKAHLQSKILQKTASTMEKGKGKRKRKGEDGIFLISSSIESIEYLGINEVWDLETKNNHTLLANGFAVHNCHELRHKDSQKYKAAKHISRNVDFRLGLSVGSDSLLLLRGGVFGYGWYGSIEEAYVKLLGHAKPLEEQGGYTLLPVKGLKVEARGWEDSIGFCWKEVTTFIRHPCDKPTVSLTIRGHALVVTEDHSLFTVNGHNLQPIRGDELTPKSLMPLDNGHNWNPPTEQYLDAYAALRITNRTQVLVDTTGLTRQGLGLKPWQWYNTKQECKYGPRLSLDIFLKYRKYLPTPTGAYFSSRGGARLIGDGQILLSNWAYILGFFLGDGWINQDSAQNVSSVSFSIDLPTYNKVVRELNKITETPLKFEEKKRSAGMVELKCSNAFFAQIVYMAFGGKFGCSEKYIPAEWIISWPLSARQRLMDGLLDSDGHHRASKYCYTTTSLKLAQSVSLLATSLGFSTSLFEALPKTGGVINGQIIGSKNKYDVYWNTGTSHRGVSTQYKAQKLWNQAPISKIEPYKHSGYVYDLEMTGHPSFVLGGCSVLGHNSATPIFNYGGEIYNVLDILSPETLGTWEEFNREWCTNQYDKPRIKDPVAFGTHAAQTGLMLRRTRKDVKRELPEVTIVPHYIEADLKVLDAMKGQAIELAKLILKQGGQDFKGQKMQAAGQFDMKMRMATGISKAPYVAEFVRMLVESSGEQVVVGLWHREIYSILMEELKDLNPVMFSGSETPVQKEVSKQKFLSGESKVMLLSLRSGAGMDGLQDVCHLVVFAELDWAYSVLKQFIGRVHRDGQDDPVTVYYLLSEQGSDPIMSDILGIKRTQLEGIINPKDDLVEELQVDENYIKDMAQKFLTDHGIEIPKNEDIVGE